MHRLKKMHPTIFIFLVILTKTLCSIQSCNQDDFIDISEGTYLPNGDIQFDGKTYTTEEYLIEKNTGLKKACKRSEKIRIRKCCPALSGYDPIAKKCVNVTALFDPLVLDEDYYEIPNANVFRVFDFTFDNSFKCSKPEIRLKLSQVNIPEPHIMKDGQLYIKTPLMVRQRIFRSPDKYCIDNFVYTNKTSKQTTIKLDALACIVPQTNDILSFKITSACMLISCVFILETVVVYASLPELRNLHGRVLVSYLLCLFISFIFITTLKILAIQGRTSMHICTIFTFLIYFFLLSSFFWLNVMSFDIWWTFSGKRGLSLERLTINKRFGAYALYAFSIPTVLTVIMASLEFSGLPVDPLLPNIRKVGCFLYGTSKLLYLHVPMVVLCVANLAFFVLTAKKIAQNKQQTAAVLDSKESTTHNQQRTEQQRLFLYVKLFTVMGINWLLEVISAFYPEARVLWMVIDTYNVLIGLMIFIIFVCKRKILRLIKNRYGQLRGESVSRTDTSSLRTVSTRDDNIRMSTRNSFN